MAKGQLRDVMCAHVARLLRNERLRQKLSLNALAAQAGLSRQMVSYVEQEMRKPTLDTLLRMAEALDLRIEDIIGQARRAASKSSTK